jgi:hypothetical protein
VKHRLLTPKINNILEHNTIELKLKALRKAKQNYSKKFNRFFFLMVSSSYSKQKQKIRT